uniref:Bactericidal permeability-increasing protein n=1 Tax=Accipiter nisus TaxID=211598 RepID=A0A8B9LZE7_9AVES
MLKTWYSFLLCCLSLRLEANPGLKVRITQKGLDYGSRIGMELLKQALLRETFPSWSGQESFSVVKVNYVISRLRINAVDFPETSASFIPGTGISLSVAHASATISADWRMNTWLLKDQGGITVSISGLFIAVIFKVSRDTTGRLYILLHNCQLSINSLKVKLNGGSSWIYSFLSGYLEKPIHTKLDKNGTVYPVGSHTEPPFVPAPFDFPNQGDSMLYLGVSSYFIKSASLAYYRAGVFNITISKEIALSYVTACPVLLKLMATSPPAVSLNADRCILQITGCVEVFAVLPNSTTQYIFRGNLTASTRGNLTITKQKLIISLLLKRFQFSLLHSILGFSEQISLVENFLSYALRSAVIPVINGKDCGQFLSTIGRKARLKPYKGVPTFKDRVMGGSLTVWLHLDRSALCWTSVQVPQSPGSGAGTEQVLAPFQTAGLGFLFTGCSVAAELRHKLEFCPDTESSHDRRMAQTGEVQKHAYSLGLRGDISNFITSLCLCASPAAAGRTK